jgi:hypothetical protein
MYFSCDTMPSKMYTKDPFCGAQKLTGESLEVIRAEFSTVS